VENKRGELNLSFGMIFSIILIVVFLAFGFFGIKQFLKMQTEIQVNLFLDDFQQDVTELYNSEQGTDLPNMEYTLPTYVTKVCFEDSEFGNLRFVVDNSKGLSKPLSRENIQHINIAKTLNGADYLCFDNVKGRITFLLSLEEGETLVTVKK
jgi:hypothetical protein